MTHVSPRPVDHPAPGHPARRVSVSHPALTSPIIDCEPPVCGAGRHAPHPPTLRPRPPRPPRLPAVIGETPVAPDAVMFADATLRRVLEVVDRRRSANQLRGLLTPPLIDIAQTLARVPPAGGTAVLRRIRLRSVDAVADVRAAEVFATYTRGPRVRAIAARVELVAGRRWQVVALQIG
ncbi:Rv3235 family protein [Mycobacterium sp. MBM]|nr:Rv3235 family protein [Mycobacterium sp. MBM]